jgi:L-lysine exporter family protein LysE/ArgO
MPFLHGFLIAATMCVTLGPQSFFVLRHGLSGSAPYRVALTCTLADFTVIGGAVAGADAAVLALPDIRAIASWLAAVFLLAYGGHVLVAARRAPSVPSAEVVIRSAAGAIVGALAFSFLNPQVYLETMATVGVGAMRVPMEQRWLFGLGAAAVSPLWFFGLVTGARRLAPVFGRERTRRVMDAATGIAMMTLALVLAGTELRG